MLRHGAFCKREKCFLSKGGGAGCGPLGVVFSPACLPPQGRSAGDQCSQRCCQALLLRCKLAGMCGVTASRLCSLRDGVRCTEAPAPRHTAGGTHAAAWFGVCSAGGSSKGSRRMSACRRRVTKQHKQTETAAEEVGRQALRRRSQPPATLPTPHAPGALQCRPAWRTAIRLAWSATLAAAAGLEGPWGTPGPGAARRPACRRPSAPSRGP